MEGTGQVVNIEENTMIKKIKFGDNEIIVKSLYPYRYDYGKGKEVLKITISEDDASFDDIKKLKGFEDPIYYYEADNLKQPYEYYSVDFSCQYSNGEYSVELTRLSETDRLLRKMQDQLGVEDVIIDNLSLEETKNYQIDFVGKQCSSYIYLGIDIPRSDGVIEHFSLDETDQNNIFSLYQTQSSNGQNVIYHADGQECRVFTAEEFNNLAILARKYITICTTKFNYLKIWINRSIYKQEVLSIEFTSTLPDDLLSQYNSIIGL